MSAFKTEVRQVIEPYRRRIVRDLSPSWLVVDLDLTGLVVSDQATTYEGAGFGYMGEVDGLARGYQFARAQLVGVHDVLLLSGFLHPGHTVSAPCLAELVAAVEQELGRARRRVEAAEPRLAEAEQELATIEAALAKRVGGPTACPRLATPISLRFVWDGLAVQAFQKLVLQSQPGQGISLVNVFDRLSAAGRDA